MNPPGEDRPSVRPTPDPERSRSPRGLHVLGAALLVAACRGPLAPRASDARAAGAPVPDAAAPAEPVAVARAEVVPGPYAGDERVADLVSTWPDHVSRATDRLALVTGLRFREGSAPRVVLGSLGDEARPFLVDVAIEGGRRVAKVTVNLEGIASGRRDADRTLLEALAAAVFEPRGPVEAPTPPWLVRAARLAAAGSVDQEVLALARRTVGEGDDAALVDEAKPEAAAATGLAAVLALVDEGDPVAMRTFFAFASEGDDPDALLARRLHEPGGSWIEAGRAALARRLSAIDLAPWRALAEARRAASEAGGAGLESALPDPVPGEIADEVRVLRARAASDAGDHERARRLLSELAEGAAARLDDPAAALALSIREEDRPGGDVARAATLEERFERDYPRAAAALRPTAGPVAEGLDVMEARRRLAALLNDGRAGAARRLLHALGERASAPELENVARRVAEAEETPDARALEVNEHRVGAWVAAPGPATARDVEDGGTAAARSLAGALAEGRVPSRPEALRLLARTAEPGRVVALLAPAWNDDADRVAPDLDALLGEISYAVLRLWTKGLADAATARAGGETLWTSLRFGLDAAWLDDRGDLLLRLRSETYATRRAAFAEVVEAGQATPELVAHALEDPALLLRRSAASAAGRLGYRAVLSVALQDPAWAVRQAAVAATPVAHGMYAADLIVPFVRSDPEPAVRRTAVETLGPLVAGRAELADVLVAALDDPDPSVGAAAERALAGLDAEDALPAARRALEGELRRAQPRAAAFARLFGLVRRHTGWDPGYWPGMPRADVERLVGRLGLFTRRGESGSTIIPRR